MKKELIAKERYSVLRERERKHEGESEKEGEKVGNKKEK